MTAQEMKEAIYNLVAGKDYVSLVEIIKAIPEAAGGLMLFYKPKSSRPFSNIILWVMVSTTLCDAFTEIIKEEKVLIKRCSDIVYAADGMIINSLPLAHGIRAYKELHWLPVVLCQDIPCNNRQGAMGITRSCGQRRG